ncbi:MAG: phosphoethanolamine transferase [Hyphomicrobium sp.]|nr:MAG: phosphoethanolamine transferase [Hyphomicrobium sp.]PPC99431.1 MAG: phosphoethanolamine transferase [Hyphomicrobium sp.]
MPSAQRPELVTLAIAIFFAAFLNFPFWQLFYRALEPQTVNDWLFVAATFAGLVVVNNWVLSLIAFRPMFRIILAIVLPITAAASFFMGEYGIVIDVAMLRNMFQTDTHEAGDLITIGLVIHVLAFGLLPAALIWMTPWVPRGWRADMRSRAIVTVVSVLTLSAIGYGYLGQFMWTFREHKELLLTLTPFNIAKAVQKYARAPVLTTHRPVTRYGEDARREPSTNSNGRHKLFVIVVGETAGASHFGLNNYERDTTPELAKTTNVVNYTHATSCGTDTAHSVPCMFSGYHRQEFSIDKASARENLLDILKRADIDVIWRENQSGCKGVCDRITTEVLTGSPQPAAQGYSGNYDEILIDGLEQRIAALERDTVIVLHMMGSHGPAYWKRYPPSFETFRPVCMTTQVSHCTREMIVNAYDNSIRYTDHVLARLIAILGDADNHNVDTGMIYMSDHGESLGENNIYLHGMPYAIAPKEQVSIPAIAWYAPKFASQLGLDTACLAQTTQDPISHDNLFHTVLGALGVITKTYDADLDINLRCRRNIAPAIAHKSR